ncbi:MAG: two-component regulator propeller domain-containing protein, partial [Bacteroidota bacterium]
PDGLSSNHIRSIYEDSKGGLWVAHEKGGISHLDLFQQPFFHINNTKAGYSKIPNNDIYCIYLDRSNRLWLGTHDGLYVRDMDDGRERAYVDWHQEVGVTNTSDKDPSGRLVGVIKPNEEGALWLGYFDYKISLFDPKDAQFTNWHHAPDADAAFSMWSLRDILISREGETYFGGSNNGLVRLRKDGKGFESFPHRADDPASISGDWVYRLLEDQQGYIWVGTRAGGLNRFDPEARTFKSWRHDPSTPQSLSDNTIKGIIEQYEGEEQVLWLGTEGGLNKFYPRTGHFKRYGVKEGLPSEVLHAMLEDDEGRIWISSNGGLTCLLPGTEEFVTYTQADGLQDNEFNEGACFKDHRGWLYFGGVNGVTAFHPDSLRPNPFMPDLRITEFKVNNELVNPGSLPNGRTFLEKKIEYTEQITLEPEDKVISFTFAGLHHAAASKIRYRYRLVPFEQRWTELPAGQRFINYTSIPPNTYQLQIEFTDLVGNWGAAHRELTLNVLPPIWGTNWFKLMLVAVILLLTLAIIHLRTRALARKQRLLSILVKDRTRKLEEKTRELAHINEQVRSRNQELIFQKQETQRMAERLHELDQSKLTFFTNISHEFRTPLSLILGQSEHLLEQSQYHDSSRVRERIRVMFRN